MRRILILVILLLIILGGFVLLSEGFEGLSRDERDRDDGENGEAISSFEECAAAGNPVMESYPRQCRTQDGRLFVEELEESPERGASEEIETRVGTLTLSYENGIARLSGTLERGTPCVQWKIHTATTPTRVEFNIIDTGSDEVCIQVVAAPQQVSTLVTSLSASATYMVRLEGETVFSGAL
jgi:hypothetical protein